MIYFVTIVVCFIGIAMFLTTVNFKSLEEKDSEDLMIYSVLIVLLLGFSLAPVFNVIIGLTFIVYSVLKHMQTNREEN